MWIWNVYVNMWIWKLCKDVSGYTIGTEYFQNLVISAEETTQYLSSIKMPGTNIVTKKFRVPFFRYTLRDKIVTRYGNLPERFNGEVQRPVLHNR